jgi:tetratricopeptide (TPR) repeat protein
MRFTGRTWVVAVALAAAPAFAAPSTAPSAPASAQADADAMSASELERILAPLSDPDPRKRAAAAKAAEELDATATSALERKLSDLRKEEFDPHVVIKSLRDTNEGKMYVDWELYDALLRAQTMPPGDKPLLMTLCVVRALAHIGTTRAIKAFVPIAMDREKVLMVEVTNEIHALGEKAVAALIESRKDPSGAVRHYAVAQQEAMQKRLPGEAVQTKSNQVLADVLRAYGLVRDMDAINVILAFVNSDRAQVRAAAREALAAFGQDAIWKLREAYTNLVGKSAPEQWTAAEVARELFAAYDKFRLQEVYSLLEDGLQKQREGKLEDAAAAFDKVLARQPLLDRRAEMVPVYVALAQQIEDSDRPRALALFRKALRLDPEGPRVTQIQSEIAYLDGMELLARGIADADAFRRALALDGGNKKAQVELERLESAAQIREERTRKWAAGGAVLALALAGVVLFGGARRRRQEPSRV